MQIIKANLIYTKRFGELTVMDKGYVGIENGAVVFVSDLVPKAYQDVIVTDYGNQLLIPGFCDLHTHAPQFENIGLGMNLKLLPWLEQLTFPTEAKYADSDYAKKMYRQVIRNVLRMGTTRVVFFSTVHTQSAQILIDLMEEVGLCGFVGKVNMDDNCAQSIRENTQVSIDETRTFYEKNKDNIGVKPIITPRFVPSCTRPLLKGLGELVVDYDAPIQSHINENIEEIEWVAQLHPEADSYADVYDRFGLFTNRTLMAHCVHMTPEETQLMAKNGVMAVHCPHSNSNLSSGIMPLKQLINQGVKAGLGTDVSGGNALSIAQTMVLAMQLSRLRYQQNPKEGYLSFEEAFYLATKGGGSFFGKVGSFEPGYMFDALVIDDSNLGVDSAKDSAERLRRFVYAGDDRNIVKRYINGKRIEV